MHEVLGLMSYNDPSNKYYTMCFHYVCVMFTDVMVFKSFSDCNEIWFKNPFRVSEVALPTCNNGQQHSGPRSATWMQDSDIFFKTKQVPSVVGTLGVANSNAMMQHNLHQHDINNVCHCKIRWFVEILCCLLGFCRIQKGSNVILYIIFATICLLVCHYLFRPLLRDI